MADTPRIPWAEIGPDFLMAWGRPDGRVEPEHVALLGPTGSGKSQFGTYIAKERARLRGSNVVIVATKPADSTLSNLHWPIVRKLPAPYGKHERYIYWPPSSTNEEQNIRLQRAGIHSLLQGLWRPNANTIILFDEIAYVEDELKLNTQIKRYWREARTLGITIIAGTQRPRFVSRYMWTESKWLAAFRPSDQEEAVRVAEILGDRKRYRDILMQLEPYEFILRHVRSNKEVITRLDA